MNFNTKLHYTPLSQATYPVLVASAFDDEPLSKPLAEIDKAWRGALAAAYKTDVLVKEGEVSLVTNPTGKGIAKIAFVGMGKREKATIESVRRAGGSTVKALKKRNLTRIVYLVDSFVPEDGSLDDTGYALIEGTRLGAYSFDRFKSEKDKTIEISAELQFIGGKGRKSEPDLNKLLTLTSSTLLARDWNNTPSNLATPTDVAKLAQNIAREADLGCEILEQKDCHRLGMGAFLGVARGSNEPPKFIVLDYKPKKYTKTLALIGKAITFDTGGICLKPAAGMEEMKGDKSGGIAVIMTLRAVGLLKPAGVRVIGIVPATENMPSGNAIKPGDVVRTQSGKSVEVINTDAEGRLILIDGLEYANAHYTPDVMIDVATLTGACVIALGTNVTGMWTEDADLAETMLRASKRTGEQVWPMPMVKDYRESISSDVADSKNVGGSEGGAIKAALFLQQFTGDTLWMHLDIAGPAFTKETGHYQSKGATGYGPRLLYAFIEEWIS